MPVTTGGIILRVSLVQAAKIGSLLIKACVGTPTYDKFAASYSLSFYFHSGCLAKLYVIIIMKWPVV
jgi:hypothetical protein